VAAGVCLLAWRMPVIWRLAVLGAWVLFSPNLHRNAAPHPGVDLLIWQGIFCWGLLCLLESPPGLWSCALVFISLAVFGALAKSNFFAISVPSVLAVAGGLCLRANQKLGAAIVLAFLAGCLGLWMALGQQLSNFGSFLKQALAIAAPYDETMCYSAPPMALVCGGIMALLSLISAAKVPISLFNTSGRRSGWFRGLISAWLAILVFVSWKNGFVRADGYHIEAFVGFIVLLALILLGVQMEAANQSKLAWPLAVALCLLAICTLHQAFFPGYVGTGLERPFSLFAENLSIVTRPTSYWQEMAQAEEPIRRGAQLNRLKPLIGKSSLDVFGSQQVLALLNNLDYRPRPVFASYAAYTLPLMRLNERFYFSNQASEFVLFKLDALGHRFPPLEDALMFRDLLLNYEAVGIEHNLLLLKTARTSQPTLTLLKEGTVRFGEQIPLRAYGDTDLWVELALGPTFAGQVRRLSYKASDVRLRIWSGALGGEQAQFEAPSPMLAAGFVASPLLLNTKDVADLYRGTRIVRPSAYAIDLDPRAERWWSDRIHYRIYRIENRLGRCGWVPDP